MSVVYKIDYEVFVSLTKNAPRVFLRDDVGSIPSIGKVFEGGWLVVGEKKNV